MRWGSFLAVSVIVLSLLLLLWPKLKKKPLKEKLTFFILLLFSWGLSLFDLPHIGGPMTWIRYTFKAFVTFIEL